MKDQRVDFLRSVLDALVDSLDATMRIARWEGAEGVPEPLRQSADQLLPRLAVANRSAAGKYSGSPKLLAATTSMSRSIQKLDTAFVEYRRANEGSATQREAAMEALGAEIDRARADAAQWA